jgi:hypothetical protein
MLEEYQVESSEHHNNANIRRKPLPEQVSEECEIYTDYDGCHHQYEKHRYHPAASFRGNRHFLPLVNLSIH